MSRAPGQPGGFAERLLDWYDRHRRELPWRASTTAAVDPWGTWVSEVMLQQTRVEVVREAWPRFLAAYPDPAALATAGDDDLHRAWQGLGYYRRARLLRDGARQVVAEHGGEIPADPHALRRLAGVGDYTCGAIASIAFGHAVPAVDGNVERVLARQTALEVDVRSAAGRRAVRELAEQRLDPRRPGDFNQALMDLGATVCTPRNPDCPDCPVADSCTTRLAGRQHDFPKLPPRRASVPVTARCLLVTDAAGAVLGARIPAGEINQGHWELPGPGVLIDHPTADASLEQAVQARHGTCFRVGAELGRARHGITHHRITLVVHAAELRGRPAAGLQFLPADDATPWSTPARKALRCAGL